MRTFEVKEYGGAGLGGHPDTIESKVVGFRAPGAGVLVVEEGTVWVSHPDGTRENLAAKSVVVYETNDWVEYGSYGPQQSLTRTYWAASEAPEDSQRRFNEIFGGSDPAG